MQLQPVVEVDSEEVSEVAVVVVVEDEVEGVVVAAVGAERILTRSGSQ
jgi:hypothetical protein